MPDKNQEESEIALLIRQIDEAFGNLVVPPEDRLVYDNSGYHLECNEIRSKFRGRHWQDLSVGDLLQEPDALSFFTNEAFRYFLPAFIKASLLDPERADRLPNAVLLSLARPDYSKFWRERKEALFDTARARGIPEQVVLELAPRNFPEIDALCWARVRTLNEDQKEVIKNFVSFLQDYRPDYFPPEELKAVQAALE
jgi:uncharacterized protein DUF6714